MFDKVETYKALDSTFHTTAHSAMFSSLRYLFEDPRIECPSDAARTIVQNFNDFKRLFDAYAEVIDKSA